MDPTNADVRPENTRPIPLENTTAEPPSTEVAPLVVPVPAPRQARPNSCRQFLCTVTTTVVVFILLTAALGAYFKYNGTAHALDALLRAHQALQVNLK